MSTNASGSQLSAFSNPPAARRNGSVLPAFVTEPLRCVRQESDDVHQFVRLIAFAEIVVKFLAAAAHGALADQDVPLREDYVRRFNERFIPSEIGKSPSLGDWRNLLKDALGALGDATPDWLRSTREFADREFATKSAVHTFCWTIDRLRRPNAELPERYSGWDLLDRITQLRNHYAHGALTGGFARRINPALEAALDALSAGAIQSSIRVIATKRYCPRERDKVEVIDAESHEVLRLGTEDMVADVAFHDVYVGPAASMSIGDFVRVGALFMYDYDRRDMLAFNGRERVALRYLSYRSGDVHAWDYIPSQLPRRFCVDDVEAPASIAVEVPAAPVPPESAASVDEVIRVPEVAASPDVVSATQPAVAQPSQDELREKAERDFDSLLALPRLMTNPSGLLALWESRLATGLSLAQQHEFFENVWKAVTSRGMTISEQSHFLGSLAQRLGLVERAVRIFKEMHTKDPSDKELMSRLGNALLVLGREQKSSGNRELSKASFSAALKVLKNAFPSGPLDEYERSMAARTYSCAVSAASRLGDYEEAIRLAELGLQACPGDPQLQKQLEYHRERVR